MIEEKEVAEEEKKQLKERIRRRRELADLRQVLSLDCGKRFIRRIFEHGGIHRRSFTGNSKTFFNEGCRSIALWVYEESEQAAPDMLKEALFVDLDEGLNDDDGS